MEGRHRITTLQRVEAQDGLVEEMEGRHRITTTSAGTSRGGRMEEMEGRHRITTRRGVGPRRLEWKRWKEDIESQLPLAVRLAHGSGRDGRKTSNHNRACGLEAARASGRDGRKTSNHN